MGVAPPDYLLDELHNARIGARAGPARARRRRITCGHKTGIIYRTSYDVWASIARERQTSWRNRKQRGQIEEVVPTVVLRVVSSGKGLAGVIFEQFLGCAETAVLT